MPSYTKEPLWHEMVRNTRRQRIPAGGTLELTPLCTLDCAMCFCHLTKKQLGDRQILTGDQWIRIIDEAYDLGCMGITISGGECLLHPDFKRIYTHAKNKGICTSINTNATLINDDFLEFFKASPPMKIQISLYGTNEDEYEKVTGHRMYQRVMDNILKIRDAGLNFRVAVTASKYAKDHIGKTIRLLRDLKIQYVLECNLSEADEGTDRKRDDYGLTTEESIDIYKEVYRIEGKKLYQNERKLELPKRNRTGETIHSLRCGAARNSFVVKWNGKLSPCFWSTYISANLLEHSFSDCWNTIVEGANQQILPIECETCELSQLCDACALKRADPDDPGHCNPRICAENLAKYKAGVVGFPQQSSTT